MIGFGIAIYWLKDTKLSILVKNKAKKHRDF